MDDANDHIIGEDLGDRPDHEQLLSPAQPSDAPSDGVDSGTDAHETGEKKASRRRVLASVVALAVIAATTGVVLTLGGSKTAAAAVIDAAHSAISAKTAFLSLNETVSTSNGTISLSGTGAIDFTNKATQVDMAGTISGAHVAISAVYLGGTVFEQVPGISQLAPGKSWISMDFSSLTSQSNPSGAAALGNDPVASIYELTQQGATVVDLGSSSVDGRSVEGYQVTFPPSLLQKQMQNSGLPSWMQSLLKGTSVNSSSETVYIDNGQLVRLAVKATVTNSATGPVSTNESVDFNNYGASVSVAAPPANEVLTFQQFLQLAGSTLPSSSSTATS